MTGLDRYASYLLAATAMFCPVSAYADNVRLTMDVAYSTGLGSPGTWRLLGRVDDTGEGVSGEFGLSAVRFFLTEIDFGIAGETISLSPGLGAINPLNPGQPSERPPAVLRGDGVIDLIYGQDLSESNGNTIVFGVGASGDTVLATGTFSAGMSPRFGRDGAGAGAGTSLALFLPTGSTPIVSGALRADQTLTLVVDNVSVTGDYTGDGLVDAADYTVWRDQQGSTVSLAADGDGDRVVDGDDYLVWAEHYGNPSAPLATPEPTAAAIATLGVALVAARRRSVVARRRSSSAGEAT